MKKLGFFVIISLGLFLSAKPHAKELSGDEKSVSAVVDSFFMGMNGGDSNLVKRVCTSNPDFKHLSTPKGKSPYMKQEDFQGFLSFIADPKSKGKVDERCKVDHVDISEPMAIVWAPYEFYYEGKFSHKGVNVFTCVHQTEGWKIAGVVDTRIK